MLKYSLKKVIMIVPTTPFDIQTPFIPKPFMDSKLGIFLTEALRQKIDDKIGKIACEIVKSGAYTGITIAGRLPYFNMCFKLFPSSPVMGGLLGTSFSVSWGSLVLQSCYALEEGVKVRSKLADPEEKESTCAEVTKVVTSIALSVLGECAFFALAYLANDKSIPMLGFSVINAAIPTYSIYLTIHAFLRERRFGPLQIAQKAEQTTFLAKLDHIITTLSTRDLTHYKKCLSDTQNRELTELERELALKALLQSIHDEHLPETARTCVNSFSWGAERTSAFFLAAVYLTWVGFLTYQGGEEISKSLPGLWITMAAIAVIANVYFMWNNMLGITQAVPASLYKMLTGNHTPTLSQKYYPVTSTLLKTGAVTASLLSFGPASVVSTQNLSGVLAIASAVALSSSMTLAPLLPMTEGIDSMIALYGERYSEHAGDFKLARALRKLRFIVASATEKAFASLPFYLRTETLTDATA